MPKSRYYKQVLDEYDLVNANGEIRKFVLNSNQFHKLLKPCSFIERLGMLWQLSPAEKQTHEFFVTRTAKGLNRK